MKKEIFAASPLSALRDGIAPFLLSLAVLCMIVYGLDQTQESGRNEAARLLEDGIRRAVVNCYAVKGTYPDSLSYIEEHYGVHIDRTKYIVHYEVFASNILPEISVIELAQ